MSTRAGCGEGRSSRRCRDKWRFRFAEVTISIYSLPKLKLDKSPNDGT